MFNDEMSQPLGTIIDEDISERSNSVSNFKIDPDIAKTITRRNSMPDTNKRNTIESQTNDPEMNVILGVLEHRDSESQNQSY